MLRSTDHTHDSDQNWFKSQTADTFLAAATFLDLCQIWAPLEQDAVSRIKYAKYHALRIAKAIKAGEDPNASNPAHESAPVSTEPVLNPTDSDVQKFESPDHSSQSQLRPHQPSVEDVLDEHDQFQPYVEQHSASDKSVHESGENSGQHHSYRDDLIEDQGPPSPPDPGEVYYHNAAAGEVSPIVSPAQSTSQNGGYFPRAPEDSAGVPSLPRVSLDDPQSASFPAQSSPGPIASTPHGLSSNVLHSFPPPPSDLAFVPHEVPAPRPYASQAAPTPSALQNPPTQPPLVQSRPLPPVAPTPFATPVTTSRGRDYVADEEAILKAQKHARWAISALNFEDVKTAVKELKGALESLGA